MVQAEEHLEDEGFEVSGHMWHHIRALAMALLLNYHHAHILPMVEMVMEMVMEMVPKSKHTCLDKFPHEHCIVMATVHTTAGQGRLPWHRWVQV